MTKAKLVESMMKLMEEQTPEEREDTARKMIMEDLMSVHNIPDTAEGVLDVMRVWRRIVSMAALTCGCDVCQVLVITTAQSVVGLEEVLKEVPVEFQTKAAEMYFRTFIANTNATAVILGYDEDDEHDEKHGYLAKMN